MQKTKLKKKPKHLSIVREDYTPKRYTPSWKELAYALMGLALAETFMLWFLILFWRK